MRFEIHHFHHHDHGDTIPPWLLELMDRIENLQLKVNQIMATLDEVLAEITADGTRLDGLATLISGLKQQVADAMAGTTLPPATQAKVDAVFAAAQANKGKLDVALNTGVPAPPVPPVAPAA